jgi:hypothetical protein
VVPSPMVASKYLFPIFSRSQSPDSPHLPTTFSFVFCLCSVTSLRPCFLAPYPDTQDRPQPQPAQSLAHTFRHIGGVPPTTPIFEFRFLSFIPSAMSGCSFRVTLASCVKHKSFISNAYRKHGGRGLKQFPTTPRLLCKNRSAHDPNFGPGGPHLPRGVA